MVFKTQEKYGFKRKVTCSMVGNLGQTCSGKSHGCCLVTMISLDANSASALSIALYRYVCVR